MVYSIEEARYIAVHSLGLNRPRLGRKLSKAQTRAELNQLVNDRGYIQIDSLNTFARAHEMTAYCTIGTHRSGTLMSMAELPKPAFIEQWAHCASLVSREVSQLLRAFPISLERSKSAHFLLDPDWQEVNHATRRKLQTKPTTAKILAREIGGGDQHRTKMAEFAAANGFFQRNIVGVGRTSTFERILALPEQFWPNWKTEPILSIEESSLKLTRIAIKSLGIARISTVNNWFQNTIGLQRTFQALQKLIAQGEVALTSVRGTRTKASDPWCIWTGENSHILKNTQIPENTRDNVRILSPFDPLVSHRPRLDELFDVHYRVGFYLPAEQRPYGYYDLLILIDNNIVGRIDLRTDKQTSCLLVEGFWLEDSARRRAVTCVRKIVPELKRIAKWQSAIKLSITDQARGNALDILSRVIK